MAPVRDWIQTYTGGQFHLLAPRASEVRIEDIAHALSQACRYAGHCRDFYSVAEHSVLVSMHCDPAVAREALLHDGSEAYLGDVSRPLKRLPLMRGYLDAEVLVEAAIAETFDLRTDAETVAAWKDADNRILVDEIGALMAHPEDYQDSWLASLQPLGVEILCYPPKRAEALFLARFGELYPEWSSGVKIEVT